MEGSAKKRLATLVGCNYPNSRHELSGCINDVHAMRDLLLSRFGFSPDDVVLLTDDAHLDSSSPSSSALPTGANIRRALTDMIDRAGPGDVLFFHYSGHGTLIPPVKPHHGWQHRRDEAIVPCDFNLITDVDFRQLVDRLPAETTFTMVSDSCHSGGLIDKEKEQIGPEAETTTADVSGAIHRTVGRYLPFESVLGHLASLSGIDSPHVGEHLAELFGAEASRKFSGGAAAAGRGDDAILLSGCQANETSADMSPFEAGSGGKAYGAFSNAIRVVLGEKEEGAVISNRELVMAARKVLRERGFEQHPCLYCSDENADAPFLWPRPEKKQQLRACM
ncbi:metacaspase-9 [Canna indica]|uniref:Metacaspase-9 n=1 Tax=Canna indica TaxID=4628 RepID=A0AAQ3L562_9LILI|nr:metacaspase-9 [Canna indica]